LQALHPMRTAFEFWSSANPLARAMGGLAEKVRENRQPAAPDNPLVQAEKDFSAAVEHVLDRYRDHRDTIYANLFEFIYGSPWVKALAGQTIGDERPARP